MRGLVVALCLVASSAWGQTAEMLCRLGVSEHVHYQCMCEFEHDPDRRLECLTIISSPGRVQELAAEYFAALILEQQEAEVLMHALAFAADWETEQRVAECATLHERGSLALAKCECARDRAAADLSGCSDDGEARHRKMLRDEARKQLVEFQQDTEKLVAARLARRILDEAHDR